jgi:uncharacterized protein YdeI (YjbR/CyaY-like superfamily)
MRFFATANAFRRWLEKNHARSAELWVGFHKRATGKKSITYAEALDQALCFGWIDGVRKSVDATSYTIRFTPRKPKSNWSPVNVRHANRLLGAGLMHPVGRAAFQARDPKATQRYSYERVVKLSPVYERPFKRNVKAWKAFQDLTPSMRRVAIWWVMSAKQEETRQRRLASLIAQCASGRKFAPFIAKK